MLGSHGPDRKLSTGSLLRLRHDAINGELLLHCKLSNFFSLSSLFVFLTGVLCAGALCSTDFICKWMTLGVQIHERTHVNHILLERGHVTGVETDRGPIECEYFVNCAGQVA